MTQCARVLNFGSVNEDRVYRVPSLAQPGETVAATAFDTFPGGKGANQSVALAHAGSPVFHAGKVGNDGAWLRERLETAGVRTELLLTGDGPTGHAVIQVDENGENSIVIFGGTNRQITIEEARAALAQFAVGDALLLQNEINLIPDLIELGHEAGLRVCFNPAPMTDDVTTFPLHLVDIFFLNEHEACALAGTGAASAAADGLGRRYPEATVIVTLGTRGVLFVQNGELNEIPAHQVNAVDTTAAGDCFIGFCLAGILAGKELLDAVDQGCRAAAVSVTRQGAISSIPRVAELSDI